MNIDLLGAFCLMIDSSRQLLESAIDDKDQLLEIFNRKIQLVFPADILFLYIRSERAF